MRSMIKELRSLIEDLAADASKNHDLTVGTFVALIFTKFNQYRGPQGEKFGNQFLKELLMGQLATAYAQMKSTLSEAQATVAQLANTNQQLLAAGSGATTTPKGRALDTADLTAIDEIIDTYQAPAPAHAQVPVPQPPTPGGSA